MLIPMTQDAVTRMSKVVIFLMFPAILRQGHVGNIFPTTTSQIRVTATFCWPFHICVQNTYGTMVLDVILTDDVYHV